MNASEQRALLIDGTCPPDVWTRHYGDWISGGFSACVVTAGGGSPERALSGVGGIHRLVQQSADLMLVRRAADIRSAQSTGRLGVLLHFQSTTPFGYDVDLVDAFWHLGIRMAGLAYNRRCPVGDGCEEPSDAGLSIFGRQVIGAMNRLGMLVDFAHTGWRTCQEALDESRAPCIASHSNAHAVRAHPRNLPDSILSGIAESGGVIGVNGFPAFVSDQERPTLDQLIDHIVHIGSLVGSEHVALGLDYSTITQPEYDEIIASGDWSADNYPPPPWHYPEGIESARTIGVLAERMSRRGFSDGEIAGVLGENWMELFTRMWPA